MVLAFYKPYGVLSQFTPDGSQNRTLSEFHFPKHVYPVGRLDADSEGLLLLTDEKELNNQLLNPKFRHQRTYWAQVENIPSESALHQMENGLIIQGRTTLPCKASLLSHKPIISERIPPIRHRESIPTCWIELVLTEGRNRQVRKMTAAVGHPTLRLLRTAIGECCLHPMLPGQTKILSSDECDKLFHCVHF